MQATQIKNYHFTIFFTAMAVKGSLLQNHKKIPEWGSVHAR